MFTVEVLKDIGWGQSIKGLCLPSRYPRSSTPLRPLPTEGGSVGRLDFLGNKTLVPKRFCDADTNGGSQFCPKTRVKDSDVPLLSVNEIQLISKGESGQGFSDQPLFVSFRLD